MRTQSNKLDFTGQNIYAGFDVYLKNWQVTIMKGCFCRFLFFKIHCASKKALSFLAIEGYE